MMYVARRWDLKNLKSPIKFERIRVTERRGIHFFGPLGDYTQVAFVVFMKEPPL